MPAPSPLAPSFAPSRRDLPAPAPATRAGRAANMLLAACLALVGLVACGGEDAPALFGGDEAQFVRDLPGIRARDTLVFLTPYSSTGYFVYRAEAMGFEYDLVRAFADAEGLTLRVVVVTDYDSLLTMLERGDGDVAGGRLAPVVPDGRFVAFTQPLYETAPTIVQRTAPPGSVKLPEIADTILAAPPPGPASASAPTPSALAARLITQPGQLAGDTVHLPYRSPYLDRLLELEDSITGDIEVVEAAPDTSIETLIRQVARGEIDLAVAPENLARLRQVYFTNVTVLPRVGPPLQVALAVRETAPSLRSALDTWLAQPETVARRRELYQRYFVDRRAYRERAASEYLSSETGRLSRYDDVFKRHATTLGWDWRLLASQAYQESRFLPTARSWAGAVGLLQLMPATARSVGVANSRDPEQNVRGAVRFLEDLERYWKPHVPNDSMRLRFVLASYNVGIGHVRDAQRLAEKNGADPLVWEDVAYWLLQKSRKPVYTDPVVRYGFARGLEPVTYVARVLERFEHYRQFIES